MIRHRLWINVVTVFLFLLCIGSSQTAAAKNTPTTSLVVGPAQFSEFGTNLTFFTTVLYPGGPLPTGSITVGVYEYVSQNSFTRLCTIAIDPNTFIHSCTNNDGNFWLRPGTWRIIVTYSGDANYNAVDFHYGSVVDYTVTKATPTLVILPTTAITLGQYATFRIALSTAAHASAPRPTGRAQVTVAGVQCDIAVEINNYCSDRAWPGGSLGIGAEYFGDGNYANAVAGNHVQQVVYKATTRFTITPSPATVALGNATLVSLGFPELDNFPIGPQGVYTVSDGSASCIISLNSYPPVTSCLLTPLSSGAKIVTATFSGSDSFNSMSATTALSVVADLIFSGDFEAPGN